MFFFIKGYAKTEPAQNYSKSPVNGELSRKSACEIFQEMVSEILIQWFLCLLTSDGYG